MKTPGAQGLGAVFTPRSWARWLLRRSGALDVLARGGTFCDPTAGEGEMVLALAEEWREVYGTYEGLDWNRFFLYEREASHLERFQDRFREELGVDFPPQNLDCRDLILSPPQRRFDLLAGNPPWVNFTDLPEDLKEPYKLRYLSTGLVKNSGSVLLGRSRVDLAALVLTIALKDLLTPGGLAAFFVPLSLFLGEGAHDRFRQGLFTEEFKVETVRAFKPLEVFPGISTRCGAFWGRKRAFGAVTPSPPEGAFPLAWEERQDHNRLWAFPAGGVKAPGSSLRVVENRDEAEALLRGEGPGDSSNPSSFPLLALRKDQKPRQGINTGGANAVFMVSPPQKRELLQRFQSLPGRFDLFYPLITGRFWENPLPAPEKWILITHGAQGKPLSRGELEDSGSLDYLSHHRGLLESRKGVLLGAQIRRGAWWALLGAGPYLFSPWKVVWPAYGADQMLPVIFGSFEGKPWVPNQALQAYIPCVTLEEAVEVHRFLQNPQVTDYLRSQGMAGGRNWAQPGRVLRLLDLKQDL